MKVGLVDIDSKIPNLALMKISAWHKAMGDTVELTYPLFAKEFDAVYASKVFFWTNMPVLPEKTVIGGSGSGTEITLPAGSDSMCPDYDLYEMSYSMGFLTRGCPRKCNFCIVPVKEGDIRRAADIEDFLRHKTVVLLDNNVLASEHGIRQIEKIVKLGVKVDFNQGLDARLIDKHVAELLARVKWLSPIRLACDSEAMIPVVNKAVDNLRNAGATPSQYFCYLLVTDNIESAHRRVEFLRSKNVDPFAQPFRDRTSSISPEQRRFARWVNHKAIFKTVKWEDYLKPTTLISPGGLL